MKRMIVVFLILCSSFILAYGQVGKPQSQKQPVNKAVGNTQKPVETKTEPQKIKVDDDFMSTYQNWVLQVQEINRIANATGTVKIEISAQELQRLAGANYLKMQNWIKVHKVPANWNFDSRAGAFVSSLPAKK